MWFGFDPGGIGTFGVARLCCNGAFETYCVSSTDEALAFVEEQPSGVGIDCPLWWSSAPGGGRKVDQWLRKKYGIPSGTVQSANSLQGAVLIQGFLLALRLRERFPEVPITEAHPKALLQAFSLDSRPDGIPISWEFLRLKYDLSGAFEGATEHERDAVVAAICAREGFEGRWRFDLSLEPERSPSEMTNTESPFGPIRYFWPEV